VFRVEPADPAKLRRILSELNGLADGRKVRGELRKALRKGAGGAMRRSKARVRSLPTRTQRHSGLRASVARATTVQVRLTGDPLVRVRISKRALGARSNLPRWMNMGEPNHGDWRGWFDDEMTASKADVEREVKAVIATFERRLMR
jgi:hypothetical protein